ncbi:MAG: NUDIX domain-containing protein [Sedimenticola sp.]
MDNLLPTIRNAARALIIQENRILLLRKEGGGRGVRFALPGGAQDTGETLHQALIRECLEEINVAPAVHSLVHVADFFKQRDSQPPTIRHLVEFLFLCSVPDTYSPQSGSHPDKHQVDVVWIEINQLAQLPLFPRAFKPYLQSLGQGDTPVYLGGMNDDDISQEH